MGLFRAGSEISTISQVQRKVTKYQKFLSISNVFLLVTSTVIVFSAVVLMKFYQIDKLDFWSSYFEILPIFKILLGVFTFLVSFYGLAISGIDKKFFYILYALLLSISFIGQLVSIFITLEVRNVITQDAVSSADVQGDLIRYGVEPAITAKWDELHRYFHCCGGNNYLTGYTDFRNTPIGKNFSLPDSCCFEYQTDCGVNILKESTEAIRNKVFVNGCLTLMAEKMQTDVIPMLITYACVGVALALVELISIVLAAAFVAQIARREKRDKKNYKYTTVDNQRSIIKNGGETDC